MARSEYVQRNKRTDLPNYFLVYIKLIHWKCLFIVENKTKVVYDSVIKFLGHKVDSQLSGGRKLKRPIYIYLVKELPVSKIITLGRGHDSSGRAPA
jgi:hypothetical protein